MICFSFFLQEKKFILQNKIDEFKDKGHEMIQKWEEKSRDFINNFTQLFGPDGTLVYTIIFKLFLITIFKNRTIYGTLELGESNVLYHRHPVQHQVHNTIIIIIMIILIIVLR